MHAGVVFFLLGVVVLPSVDKKQVVRMKTNDYVKYVTETLVQYMEQPRAKRKLRRQDKKQLQQPFINKWFGILPYAIFYFFKKKE